jgi:hypothetical protein
MFWFMGPPNADCDAPRLLSTTRVAGNHRKPHASAKNLPAPL